MTTHFYVRRGTEIVDVDLSVAISHVECMRVVRRTYSPRYVLSRAWLSPLEAAAGAIDQKARVGGLRAPLSGFNFCLLVEWRFLQRGTLLVMVSGPWRRPGRVYRPGHWLYVPIDVARDCDVPDAWGMTPLEWLRWRMR